VAPAVGREAIEKQGADGFKDYTADPSTLVQVTVIGTEVMLRTGDWSGTWHSPNGPVQVKGHWTTTDVRDGGTWRIRMEAYNVTPPPSP
jgi:hypothetical protein